MWEEKGRAGKKDGRGFPNSPLQSEDDAGNNSGQRLGKNDLTDSLPLRAAEGNTNHSEFIRDTAEGLFRRADDYGKGHDG